MKIIALAIIKNESDVIESFVRYNLRFFDELHIVDHHSSDSTAAILAHLKSEGLPIFLYSTPLVQHKQARVLTDLMQYCLMQDPDIDFAMCLDADEFLFCNSRQAFEQQLGQIPTTHVGLIPWRTYLPNTLNVEPHFLRTFDEVRLDMILMSKVVFSRENGLNGAMSAGNHFLNYTYTENYQEHHYPCVMFLPEHLQRFRENIIHTTGAEILSDAMLMLAHYPIRSLPQLLSKTLCGALSMARDNAKNPDKDLYWQVVGQQLLNRKNYTLEDLRKEAFIYRAITAYDPDFSTIQVEIEQRKALIDTPLALVYTDLIEKNPLRELFDTALRLLHFPS
ncbi:glycosyltransferase family 2 protein [Avibacterium volantium]|uniref:Glycosyl transferase family 2 n=1 Tax=Avibacterium volantium TaxID=762 RepID=A0A447SN14_AVIVO|nr:glycosyltransferase family 2 protein [Avibacterium volantium]VEB21889.1 Uncharacterised protein [Avibacterium volantium]